MPMRNDEMGEFAKAYLNAAQPKCRLRILRHAQLHRPRRSGCTSALPTPILAMRATTPMDKACPGRWAAATTRRLAPILLSCLLVLRRLSLENLAILE